MADTQEPITTPAAPVAAVSASAPIDTASATTAAVSTEAAASSAPLASATETKPSEPTKTETPVAETKVENILGEAKTESKKTEEKPVEKAAETKTVEQPKVELPTYEAFKTPENVKLEGDSLNEFTKLLAEAETGKLDHKGYQEFGQKLVDYGTKIVNDSINRLNESYVQIHQQAQKARFDALKADATLGGDKLPETISALQRSISEYGGSEQQIAEFRKEITDAGLGASPAICRLIYNMQQKINKYTTEGNENRMVPGQKPAPTKVKDYQRFYS